MILYLSTGFHSDNHNPSNEMNFLLIFLFRKLWKRCFWYNHQESNTWDPSHFVAIKKKNTIDPNQKKLKKNISVRIPVVYQNNRSWNSQNSFSNITINQRQWTKGRWDYKRKIHDAWRSGNHWTITADSVILKLPITNIEMNPSRLRLVFIKSAKNLHNLRRKYILRFRETMR